MFVRFGYIKRIDRSIDRSTTSPLAVQHTADPIAMVSQPSCRTTSSIILPGGKKNGPLAFSPIRVTSVGYCRHRFIGVYLLPVADAVPAVLTEKKKIKTECHQVDYGTVLQGIVLVWILQTLGVCAWTAPLLDRRQVLSDSLRVATSGAASVALVVPSVIHPTPVWGAEGAVSSSSSSSSSSYYLSDLSNFSSGPRGLQYKIERQGQGQPPIRGQQIYAKYTLWTGGFGEDGGKQVDSNTGVFGKPLPVIVGIGRVIKGWDLTLLEMKLGEIRRIVVPSELGYGDKGAGGAIPPKATLYFEVEITDMDPVPKLTETQQKWLEENPL